MNQELKGASNTKRGNEKIQNMILKCNAHLCLYCLQNKMATIIEKKNRSLCPQHLETQLLY